MSPDPLRPYSVVSGVLREALRASGKGGVVVFGTGPETALLEEWMGKAGIDVIRPSDAALLGGASLLSACAGSEDTPRSPGSGGDITQDAAALAGRSLASVRGLLLLGPANKTELLLSPRGLVPDLLPLGDIFASQILDLTGDCTLPPALKGCSPKEVAAVDEALEAYYGGRLAQVEAFGGLKKDLRTRVSAGMREAQKGWRPLPLIPKLGVATLGLDLDL